MPLDDLRRFGRYIQQISMRNVAEEVSLALFDRPYNYIAPSQQTRCMAVAAAVIELIKIRVEHYGPERKVLSDG